MLRLVMAALCTGVLACHGGSPTDEEPSPDAGSNPDAGLPGDGGSNPPDAGTQGFTLQGTTYYLGGTSLDQAPRPFGSTEQPVPRVLFSDEAGGYTAATGQVVAQGQVRYPTVPMDSRPVWLYLNSGWHQVTGSPAVLDLAVPARRGRTGSSGKENVTLNLTGLEAWKSDWHEVELFVPSHNVFRGPYSGSLSQGFGEGATSATATVLADQLGVGELSPSQGDRVYVYQVEHVTLATSPLLDSTTRVAAAGVIADLSLPSGGSAQRTVALDQAPKRAVTIQVDAPAFEAAAERPSAPTRSLSMSLLAEGHQPIPEGAYEAWRDVPTIVERYMLDRFTQLPAAPTANFSWTTSYADALPSSGRRFVSVSFLSSATLTDPQGNSRQRNLEVRTRQKVPAEGSWTLTPVLSVPRQIRIEGVEQSGVTTVSGRAHLSWSAPALGTASSYSVEVWYVGSNQANNLLGRFFTPFTEFIIPIDLQAGRLHYAVITALGRDGDREGRASSLSGFFRGP